MCSNTDIRTQLETIAKENFRGLIIFAGRCARRVESVLKSGLYSNMPDDFTATVETLNLVQNYLLPENGIVENLQQNEIQPTVHTIVQIARRLAIMEINGQTVDENIENAVRISFFAFQNCFRLMNDQSGATRDLEILTQWAQGEDIPGSGNINELGNTSRLGPL